LLFVALTPPFHRNAYIPSLKVYYVDLDLEPHESLAQSPRILITVAFANNVIFLAGGVVVAAPNPFCMQGENLLHGKTDDDGILDVPSLVASSCMTSSLDSHRLLVFKGSDDGVWCSWRLCCPAGYASLVVLGLTSCAGGVVLFFSF
jgi:hypothetical protein